MFRTNRIHDQSNAGRFRAAKFRFLQINVVDDFRNWTQRLVPEVETLKQDLEGTKISFMSEFRIKHVKAQFIWFRPIAFGGHEFEARARIDKSANKPRGGDAIDVNTLSS